MVGVSHEKYLSCTQDIASATSICHALPQGEARIWTQICSAFVREETWNTRRQGVWGAGASGVKITIKRLLQDGFFFLTRDSSPVAVNHDLYCEHFMWPLPAWRLGKSWRERTRTWICINFQSSQCRRCRPYLLCSRLLSVLEHQCPVTLNAVVQPWACSKWVN